MQSSSTKNLLKEMTKESFGEGFKIGADPEIFLQKDGKIISAHDIVPGTKEEPFQIDEYGTKVLSDGIALEFNIKPASTQEEFNFLIDKALESIKERLPEGVTFLENVSGAFLEPVFMNLLPSSVAELGCNPDHNAWNNGNHNPQPNENIFKQPFRCVAGHIHIGWVDEKEGYQHSFQLEPNQVNKISENEYMRRQDNRLAILHLTQMLDMTLGIPFWREDKTLLKNDRMRLYGNMGAFRFKPYGLEYRTPSNAWLWDKSLRNQIFKKVKEAFYLAKMKQKSQLYGIPNGNFHGALRNIQAYFNSLKADPSYKGPTEKTVEKAYHDLLSHKEILLEKVLKYEEKLNQPKPLSAAKCEYTSTATSSVWASIPSGRTLTNADFKPKIAKAKDNF